MELTPAEKQFLMLVRGVKLYPKDSQTGEKVVANLKVLKKRALETVLGFGRILDPLTFNEETITKLLGNGLVEQLETTFELTSVGEDLAKRARKEFLDESFSDDFKRLTTSKTLATIAKQVQGKDLGQFSMMTMPQLNKLLNVLQLTPDDTVIDLGCGLGKITEYIFQVTQVNMIGIDIASTAIKLAQERTQDKKEKLNFRVDDMDDLAIPPASVDCIIAIDTLHFAEELESTIGQ
ncbi:MAG: class I SAM-dependent methyltransferase, partial [Candidatus Hodarchaeota archaeon]